jgi:hypothetical protein
MARARRRNPMPRRGAILIANPAKAKKSVDFKKVLARLKANGKKRHNRRRRNPVALRMNGLMLRNPVAIRANRKRKHNRRRRNPVALRMNPLAIRANGKKRHNRKARRHNGKKFMLFNRRHRRNPEGGIVGKVESMIAKVPVVGKIAAPIAVPAAAAAVIVGAVHYGIKMGMQYVQATVAGYVAPIGYTVGAAILGVAVQFVPASILSTSSKRSIAALAIAGGGAVDGIRYLSAREASAPVDAAVSGLGEGGYWQLAGDPDSAAVSALYKDCSYADAAVCGPDLDPAEGEACIAGARAWCATFPATIQVTRTADGGPSRHAGKHGHRWGWAIASLGFPTFRQIAAMPAAKRVETLGKLRHAAMSAHHSATASHSGGYGALVLAQ